MKKKLQRNFTNPEQSKRLLELGVPAWTADLYFYEEGCISNNDEPSGVIPYDEVYEDNSKETMFSSYVELPCWSVGRLMEIFDICCPLFDYNDWCNTRCVPNEYVAYIIGCYERATDNKDLEFSKLEE